MRNITIILDEEVADWARTWAANHRTSVSRLLGQMARDRMLEEEGYEASRKQYFSRRPLPLKKSGRYPRRDEVHERTRLR